MMDRRVFIKNGIVVTVSGVVGTSLLETIALQEREVLSNGIRLPLPWPPQSMSPSSYKPMPVPYLDSPPGVIPIDGGRQLFVDDFLIESTTLSRKFHTAKKIDANPVFKPETDLEKGIDGLPVACPKDGGVWWDAKDQLFKMWYEAGWIGSMAYAESKDGLHWERPSLDIVEGTNRLLPGLLPDSTTVFLDHDAANPDERFKLFLRGPNWAGSIHGYCMVSPDGIHWSEPVKTGVCGDRSTIFYNPFRKKWIYSIRSTKELGSTPHGRSRFYHEHSNFMDGADWNDKYVFWTGADELDIPDPEIGDKAQLYNLSAVGYETLMLGLHQVHLGPPNRKCAENGTPKVTELMVSFSRDGFHWHRPLRDAFIPATRQDGDWDRGYVQSVGGICAVMGDLLWFYYTGFQGDSSNNNPDDMKSGMYANGSTGIAVLRRDGFAGMEAAQTGGQLITRLVTFTGLHFFVNVDCPNGRLTVEVLNEQEKVLAPYTQENCLPISIDSTIHLVSWKGVEDLSPLLGQRVRFRFYLECGSLYAFWISPNKSGASYGPVAAGGPGYVSGIDDVGVSAYEEVSRITRNLSTKKSKQ